jgi:hypothetical protein
MIPPAQTTKYQQETPSWLWSAWTAGPGADADRYDRRICRLIAADVLDEAPEQLDDEEVAAAEELAKEVSIADV